MKFKTSLHIMLTLKLSSQLHVVEKLNLQDNQSVSLVGSQNKGNVMTADLLMVKSNEVRSIISRVTA